MRFVDTKRFSPVIYGNDLPKKRDLYHYDSKKIPDSKKEINKFMREKGIVIDIPWWEKQWNRCINGFTVKNAIEEGGEMLIEGYNVELLENGDRYIPDLALTIHENDIRITGRHYFYLNFWTIKRLSSDGRKKPGPPRFTDLSFENWWIRERMIKECKDMLWAKCRQRGLSEEEACDVAYEYLFFGGSQSAIVAGQDKYSENTMNFVKRGIDDLKNTQFYKKSSPNNMDHMRTEKTISEVYCRTAKDNSQVLSSLTPSKVKAEEVAIWKKGFVIDLIENVRPSIEAEGVKTGYITCIGTSGNIEDSLEDMEDIFWNPAKHGMLEFTNYYSEGNSKIGRFIPAIKFEIIDEDGNSLCKESGKKIEEENSKKTGKAKMRHRTMKPLKPEHIFMISTGGFFGEEIINILSLRTSYINSREEVKNMVTPYRLEWVTDIYHWKDGVKAIPDPEGEVLILEHPKVDKKTGKPFTGLYHQGTDSYDQDESRTSSSKGASVIKKGFLSSNELYNLYVCMVIQRPSKKDGGKKVFYENTAKMAVYYGCENLIEHSKIVIFEFYQKYRMDLLLKLKPEAAIANKLKESKAANSFGIDPSFVPHALSYLVEYVEIKENVNKMFFPIITRAFSRFRLSPNYNCDITIACAFCETSVVNTDFIQKRRGKEDENTDEEFVHYQMNDGEILVTT